jgi:hypothetical protein
MIERYLGLIEVALLFFGFLAFYIWQMRELKRLKREREAKGDLQERR